MSAAGKSSRSRRTTEGASLPPLLVSRRSDSAAAAGQGASISCTQSGGTPAKVLI